MSKSVVTGAFIAKKPITGGIKQSVGEILVEAGRASTPVLVTYITVEGKVESRFIEPLEIKAHGRKIVLYAHHRSHHRTASFILDRIVRAELKPKLQWESSFAWRSG